MTTPEANQPDDFDTAAGASARSGADATSAVPTFDEIEAHAWGALAEAVRSARHAFHICAVATVDAGGLPQVRSVVLRDADRGMGVLTFHTDARSPKVAELRETPAAGLVFYDPAAKLQVRALCSVTVHTDDAIADSRWQASRPSSRMCYAATVGSSTPVPAPPAAPTDPDTGRAHFAAVRCHVHTLEWLHLAHTGHRRARMKYRAGERIEAAWLAP